MSPSLTRSARRGNYSMMMGLTIMPFLALSGLAIDISYIRLADSQCQDVADAASQAALIAYRRHLAMNEGDYPGARSAGTDAANYVISVNDIVGGYGTLTDLDWGEWDTSADDLDTAAANENVNAARAEVSRTGANSVDMMFGPIFGIAPVSISKPAVSASRSIHVVLTLDVTLSWSESEYHFTREAAKRFVEILYEGANDGDRIGMTTWWNRYNYEVLPMMRTVDARSNHDAVVEPRFDGLHAGNIPGTQMLAWKATSPAGSTHHVACKINGDSRVDRSAKVVRDWGAWSQDCINVYNDGTLPPTINKSLNQPTSDLISPVNSNCWGFARQNMWDRVDIDGNGILEHIGCAPYMPRQYAALAQYPAGVMGGIVPGQTAGSGTRSTANHEGGTNHHVGLMLPWYMHRNPDVVTAATAATPGSWTFASIPDASAYRAVILLTDGQPNPVGSWGGAGNGWNSTRLEVEAVEMGLNTEANSSSSKQTNWRTAMYGGEIALYDGSFVTDPFWERRRRYVRTYGGAANDPHANTAGDGNGDGHADGEDGRYAIVASTVSSSQDMASMDGINIWNISFRDPCRFRNSTDFLDMAAQGDGTCVEVDESNPEQLEPVFEQIARSLPTSIVK